MTATTIRVQMAQRKDTAANWTAANPILLSGELGYETDTEKFKIGDGTTNWNSLAYLPIPDGSGNLTITGNLEIGTTGTLTFEGSTADGFETTLAVTDPTADRTITLPDVTGTVVTTGDTGSVTSTMLADGTIVNADVSATAEIAVSKLANGTANQVIVTDGTNVSWSDDLTLAGNLTVNGTTTTINTQDLLVEDKNIIIGNVGTPTDITADGGGITLKGTTDKTINWVDATDAWTFSEHVDLASGKEVRIAGTKVMDATSLGTGVVSSSLTSLGTIATGVWEGTEVGTAYGGTGQTTYTDGQLLIGKTDGTLAKATVTAGTGITVTNGDGTITIDAVNNGTVTAVTGTSPIASTGGATPDISIQDGTTTQKGAVQLEDSTSSTSTTTAATPNSVKAAYDLAAAAMPSTGGVMTGDLIFEGSTADDFETTLTVVDPTADRTITLPDVTGTVVTTGDSGSITSTMIADGTIVDGDINASAAIADTKLGTIATAGKVSNSATTATDANTASAIVARDASGNFSAGAITASLTGNASTATALATARTIGGVSFDGTANIDLPGVNTAGNQDTSGNAATATKLSTARTFEITGDITGTVSSDLTTGASIATSIAAGAIVDADINATAGIVDTKLATISTAGKVSNSATTATDANTASAIVARDASGNFAAGTITADLAGNAATVTTNANLTGDVTSVGNATSIAAGVIVDADVNASAAIAGTKISPDFGSQNVVTTGTVTGASLIPTSSTVPTNGVYLPSANNVAISTNSSERIRIGANGEIGLGGANYGTSGQVLTSAGSGAAPTWQTPTATTDKIEEGNTSAEVIDTGSDGRFVVTTEGSERLRVTSAGLVGIGTTSPAGSLDVVAGNTSNYAIIANNSNASGDQNFLQFRVSSTVIGDFNRPNGTNDVEFNAGFGAIAFGTGTAGTPTERARIDSSGRLLVGTSTSRNVGAANERLIQVESLATGGGISIVRNSNDTVGARLVLAKSRGASVGSNTIVQNGDDLGGLIFAGADGNDLQSWGAQILAEVDGTPGVDDLPSRLVFSVTADGSASPSEAMRINNAGELLVGYTSDNGAYKLQVNSQIFATSAIIATSDGRYKENVAALDGCVDLVKALRPVSFDWKVQEPVTRVDEDGETVVVREAHNFPDGKQVGFIAQEVEEVLADKPWLGSVIKQNVRPAVTDADGNELAPEEEFLGIAEGNLVAVLTSALKDAIGEIESLKARVAALESV